MENAAGSAYEEIGVAVFESEFEVARERVRSVPIFLRAREIIELLA